MNSDAKIHSEMALSQKTAELFSVNATYLEDLYEMYLSDPHSVEPTWRNYFQSVAAGEASLEHQHSLVRERFTNFKIATGGASSNLSPDLSKALRVIDLVYSYRRVGHQRADTDPLQMMKRLPVPELDLNFHQLSTADLRTRFDLSHLSWPSGIELSDLIQKLQTMYCGPIGFEYMHMTNITERAWMEERIESPLLQEPFSQDKRQWILKRLIAADGLEKYIGMKYSGQKRFSLEGGDSFIPLLDQVIATAASYGAEEIAMGMAHRGRLNVLVNIMGKSPEHLFREFDGVHNHALLSGDVKYHNGFSSDIRTANHGVVHLALGFNPSHLEIVSPVIEGSVRARLDRHGESMYDKVMAIQVHGDSAFSGQGVVMETLNMSLTNAYGTGGSIHIIINNQVGFTTSEPFDLRSTFYCTDIGKMIEVPIFHVNADCPEAVMKVAQLAVEYRHQFHKNVLIDLVCYRRHGHNESDEPSGTQPLMYKTIKGRPSVRELYAKELREAGVIDTEFLTTEDMLYRQRVAEGKSVVEHILSTDTFKSRYIADWAPFKESKWTDTFATAMSKKKLLQIASALDQKPAGFVLQKQVEKVLEDRIKMTAGTLAINWGYAEILAYATILYEGVGVRMTGEDCRRGTFSHRHAVLHDIENDSLYTPLSQVSKSQAPFAIYDSLLSEEAVVAFEYGYSSSAPNVLVLWEAQFGDFVNGAQVVIDQFISSGEEKWGRFCGLVLLLPHGYEGQGAEHSSARLERFLQLCAHDNMQVCVPTTPAQMYHLLRRQGLKPYRKPLIVMTPKSLLRSPLATSTFDELAEGAFELVIPDTVVTSKQVKRVVLCQGKVYYDLFQKRQEQELENVALVRVEQLYPFPEDALKKILGQYKSAPDIVWCQEEPKNQGAWWGVRDHLIHLLSSEQQLHYAGRHSFAAPAVGYPALHKEQQAALVNDALNLKK